MKEQIKDSLGNRMKRYEATVQSYLGPRSYHILRLDGKSFHSFVKHIEAIKPYDLNLMSRMDMTAKFLCANIQGAKLAYIASDEISILITDIEKLNTQLYFDGSIQKITSISASMASAFFNSISSGYVGRKPYDNVEKYTNMDVNDWILVADKELAFFDARVFSLPEKSEVMNYFRWRTQDWERNSLQMLAQSLYSHAELHAKQSAELHEMIHQAGDNWAKYPDDIKRGRICSTHLGGMWGIYPMPDLRDDDQKKFFSNLIPEYGYEL